MNSILHQNISDRNKYKAVKPKDHEKCNSNNPKQWRKIMLYIGDHFLTTIGAMSFHRVDFKSGAVLLINDF